MDNSTVITGTPVADFATKHKAMRKENGMHLPDNLDLDKADVRVSGVVLEGLSKDANGRLLLDVEGTEIAFKLAKGQPEDASQYNIVTGTFKEDIVINDKTVVYKGYKVYRAIAA